MSGVNHCDGNEKKKYLNCRSELDIDSKKWRLRADFLNDLAMGIEIFMLPRFPELSTYILCGTTTMKAIVGVTGGKKKMVLLKIN